MWEPRSLGWQTAKHAVSFVLWQWLMLLLGASSTQQRQAAYHRLVHASAPGAGCVKVKPSKPHVTRRRCRFSRRRLHAYDYEERERSHNTSLPRTDEICLRQDHLFAISKFLHSAVSRREGRNGEPFRPCFSFSSKSFRLSHRIFRHMHGLLTIDKKK